MFRRDDILFLVFLFLSFHTLHSKQSKSQHILSGQKKDIEIQKCILRITKSSYSPSSWVKPILRLFFSGELPKYRFVLPIPPVSIQNWMRDRTWGRKRIFWGSSSFLIIRLEDHFSLHFFYSADGYYIFHLPRNEKTYQDLYVLFQKGGSSLYSWIPQLPFPTEFQSFEMPSFLLFLR